MRIKRIDDDKKFDKRVNRIEIAVGCDRFTITQDIEGGIRIHRNDGEKISISPCVRNEITVR